MSGGLDPFALICTLIGAAWLYWSIKAVYKDMQGREEEGWKTVLLMCLAAVGFGVFLGGVTSLWT